jgi:hypothetical protein
MTLCHHTRSAAVMGAIGGMGSLYITIFITAAHALLAAAAWVRMREPKRVKA